MVLGVSWGPERVLVSTEMAGFRVPGAVGEPLKKFILKNKNCQ